MHLPDIATIEARIAAAEAQVPNLRKGCEKRIIWAGVPATKTALSVLYLHGFSGTAQEIRPLPDLVAAGLGANIHFTRLTGHGQDGPALAAATLEAWENDVAAALAVAQTIGDNVVIIGCSTGCTLATLALARGAQASAVIYISPNFGLASPMAQTLLDMPGARRWAQYIIGANRRFPAINADHAAYWTTSYPTKAIHTMAAAVRAARRANLARITTPALFCYNMSDRVVSAQRTRHAMENWGGPAAKIMLTRRDDDDAMGHVMAGDIFSPGQTRPLAQKILSWLDAGPIC